MAYKRITAILLLLVAGLSIKAQPQLAGSADIKNFYNTTTLVVKSGNPFSFFNPYIEKAVEAHWHITPYTIVEHREFEEKRQNNNYSFLLLSEATYSERRQQVRLDVLSIVLGARSRSINDMPDLGSVPLCYYDDDADSYLYKLPALVKFIQYQLKAIESANISSPMALLDFHNGFSGEVKNKTLWLTSDDLAQEVNTRAKIESVYNYNFEIVSRDKLQKAISAGDDILFVHKVAPFAAPFSGRVFKFIISAKSGKAYYAGHHTANNKSEIGLLKEDFQVLAQ